MDLELIVLEIKIINTKDGLRMEEMGNISRSFKIGSWKEGKWLRWSQSLLTDISYEHIF